MDRQAFIKSIVEETLPNDEALMDLFARKNQHAASDPSDPLFEAIQEIFEDATLAATKAVAAHEPIVKVLSEVLQAIGRLKVQALKSEKEHTKTAPQVKQEQVQQQEQLPTGAVLGDNTHTEHKADNNKADTNKISLKFAEKSAAQAEPESPPPKGRHKLRAFPPSRLFRSARSRSVSPSGGFGSLSAAPTPLNPAAHLPVPPSSTTFEAVSTGLSAHPTQLTNTPFTTKPTTKPTTKRKAKTQLEELDCQPVRKRLRRAAKTPLSKEIVSDSDASDTTVVEDTMRTKKQKSAVTNARDSEGSKSHTPEAPAYIDLSEGLSGFEYEYFDENGAPAKRPHGRLALVNGEIKDALTVKLKLSPQKMHDKLQELQSTKTQAMPKLNPTSKNHPTSTAKQTPLATTPLTKGKRPSTRSHPSPPFKTEPDTPSMPPTFPPFPPLTPSQLPHFTKGLTIAIENIISDHAASPTLSVLDIITDLEDDAPTLPHDDYRQVVMRGNQYVYAAVRKVVGEQEDTLPKGGAKGLGTGDGVGAEAEEKEKVYYEGPGRAWKKTTEDADPDFVGRETGRDGKGGWRKSVRGGDTWDGTEQMFAEFCAHVRREYKRKVEVLGVEVGEELPDWLVE